MKYSQAVLVAVVGGAALVSAAPTLAAPGAATQPVTEQAPLAPKVPSTHKHHHHHHANGAYAKSATEQPSTHKHHHHHHLPTNGAHAKSAHPSHEHPEVKEPVTKPEHKLVAEKPAAAAVAVRDVDEFFTRALDAQAAVDPVTGATDSAAPPLVAPHAVTAKTHKRKHKKHGQHSKMAQAHRVARDLTQDFELYERQDDSTAPAAEAAPANPVASPSQPSGANPPGSRKHRKHRQHHHKKGPQHRKATRDLGDFEDDLVTRSLFEHFEDIDIRDFLGGLGKAFEHKASAAHAKGAHKGAHEGTHHHHHHPHAHNHADKAEHEHGHTHSGAAHKEAEAVAAPAGTHHSAHPHGSPTSVTPEAPEAPAAPQAPLASRYYDIEDELLARDLLDALEAVKKTVNRRDVYDEFDVRSFADLELEELD